MISVRHWNDSEMLSLVSSGLEVYNKDDLIIIIENLAERLNESIKNEDAQGEVESKLIEKAASDRQTVVNNISGIKSKLSYIEMAYSVVKRVGNMESYKDDDDVDLGLTAIHKMLDDIHKQEVS